jgi:hypothetical protein
MNGVLATSPSRDGHATATLKLSPHSPGITGVVRAPRGQAVPIGELLAHLLERYGLERDREFGAFEHAHANVGVAP